MFSVKIGLVTLCNGKLVDKFRCKIINTDCKKYPLVSLILGYTNFLIADVFSLISDTNGCLVLSRFSEYLQECLALPAMVLESPTFGENRIKKGYLCIKRI